MTFEVRQVTARNTCHICEPCLGRSPVRIEQEGRTIDGQERRNHLSELSMRLMHRVCRDVLRNLLARSDDPALREVAVYFDRNVQLSPSRAATLLLALSNSTMDTDPGIFEVQLRSIAHRQEFARLSEREKHVLWPVLSPAIQNRLIWLGLAPVHYAAPRQSRAGQRATTLSNQF